MSDVVYRVSCQDHPDHREDNPEGWFRDEAAAGDYARRLDGLPCYVCKGEKPHVIESARMVWERPVAKVGDCVRERDRIAEILTTVEAREAIRDRFSDDLAYRVSSNTLYAVLGSVADYVKDGGRGDA